MVVVPEGHEIDKHNRQEDVTDKWEADSKENLPIVSTIDLGSFKVSGRHALKSAIHHEEIKAKHIGFQHDDARHVVDDSESISDLKLGRKGTDDWNHHSHKNRGIDDFAGFKFETGTCIGR